MGMTAEQFSTLPEAKRAQLAILRQPKTNKYIPATLTTDLNENKKQAAFLLLDQREVFYGGAAAGGKTAGILASALQYVDEPGYAALLLRRNYKQLSMPGSWIPMAHEWLDGTDARWHQGMKQWTFPSGATLTFGFVGLPLEDKRKYETAAFQFIGIDELTAWLEDDYRFLFSRLRRKRGLNVPVRMRSGSNPGGRGHEWVRKRFVLPETREKRAVYLPARLDDNPYIDAEDYIQSLRELHPVHWQRLLHGDWDIGDPGELFRPRMWLRPEHFLDGPPDIGVRARVRYWDLAAAEPSTSNPDPDYTAGARLSFLTNGNIVIEHMIRMRGTPLQVENTVGQTMRSDPPGTKHWMERTAGAGSALYDHYKRNVAPQGMMIHPDSPAGRSKGERATPLAAEMEKGKVYVVRGDWNEPLFDEMEAFSADPQHSGAHDDQVDACSGAFKKLSKPHGAGVSGMQPRGSIRR